MWQNPVRKCEVDERKTETLIDASKEFCVKVSTEESKYMFMFHQQNVGQNHDIKIANGCFEKVAR